MILWLRNKISWGAACFLSLFLFIQAEKLFHSHRNVDHFAFSKQATVSSPKGCSICDFQLGRDADLVESITGTCPFHPHRNSCNYITCAILSRNAGEILGRGPPSL